MRASPVPAGLIAMCLGMSLALAADAPASGPAGGAADSARSAPAPGAADSARTAPASDTTRSAPAPGAAGAPAPGPAVQWPPPTLYLAWNAPSGDRRADAHRTAPCTETGAADTLYLSFATGRDAPKLCGLMATLYFRAQAPDSLGPAWTFDESGEGPALEVQFAGPADTWGAPVPWKMPGFGAKKYDRTRASGRLRMVFAVAEQVAAPVAAGARYAFARVIVPRVRPQVASCAQPVCVEWASASFSFEVDDPDVDATRTAGDRYVTWNSRDRRVCADHAGGRVPAAWQPKGGTPGR